MSYGATARLAQDWSCKKDPAPSPCGTEAPSTCERDTQMSKSFMAQARKNTQHAHTCVSTYIQRGNGQRQPQSAWGKAGGCTARQLQESRGWGAKAGPSSKPERKAPRGEGERTLCWRAGQRSNYYSSMTGKVTKIEVLEGSKTICEVGPNLTNSFSQNGENN